MASLRNLPGTTFKERTRSLGIWLLPGMQVKRWLSLMLIGMVTMSVGLAIWIDLRPVFRTGQLLEVLITSIARMIPNDISGPLAVLAGLGIIFWGLYNTLFSITEVLVPDGEAPDLANRVLTHRRLSRGARIVAIGGGTGLSTLLRGLKKYSSNITAVVTVADDGGSSGRLRKEFGALPPGDLRNCLAALADEEKLLTELFQYRFPKSTSAQSDAGLAGHSFGNLFLTVMAEIAGDWEKGLAAASEVLAIRGQVLPSTVENVTLWADLEDGRRIEGESNIPESGGRIKRVGCIPEAPRALPRVLQAIAEADLIIIAPGSLFTSIIPNLLVPEIAQALRTTAALTVYVSNLVVQAGETEGFTVSDHIKAIEAAAGGRFIQTVLVQKDTPQLHHQVKGTVIPVDREALAFMGLQLLGADVIEKTSTAAIRHNSPRLARVLMHWYGKRNQQPRKTA
ncbi:gluconeogenesis factor YvcK family protein [Anthocerotibacter panamensis]|uniref:gluconeogenesis factor YvcK family protein n=1 Tax=Anthocerotibacter panamensis TaxID=2857077 RepID=UPI001C4075B6|nr:gluconeogenesis factor YvcK family protein [Anthocerotibacter panamensis]